MPYLLVSSDEGQLLPEAPNLAPQLAAHPAVRLLVLQILVSCLKPQQRVPQAARKLALVHNLPLLRW